MWRRGAEESVDAHRHQPSPGHRGYGERTHCPLLQWRFYSDKSASESIGERAHFAFPRNKLMIRGWRRGKVFSFHRPRVDIWSPAFLPATMVCWTINSDIAFIWEMGFLRTTPRPMPRCHSGLRSAFWVLWHNCISLELLKSSWLNFWYFKTVVAATRTQWVSQLSQIILVLFFDSFHHSAYMIVQFVPGTVFFRCPLVLLTYPCLLQPCNYRFNCVQFRITSLTRIRV